MICEAAEVTFTLREFQDDDSDACAAILDALPEWFGIAEVNAGHVAGLTAETALVFAMSLMATSLDQGPING